MTESLFGPLVSTWNVEQAVITTYREWMNEYLAEIERKNGLRNQIIPRPAAPESLHGGLDFLSWKAEELPKIIVTVEPAGEPERENSVGYVQDYEVRVGCIVLGAGGLLAELPEDDARAIASYYGAASMLLVHQGGLGGLNLVEETVMVQSPRLTYPNPDTRQVVQSEAIFHAFVATIIEPNAGVAQYKPGESPYYGGEPEAPFEELKEVKKIDITVKGEPI